MKKMYLLIGIAASLMVGAALVSCGNGSSQQEQEAAKADSIAKADSMQLVAEQEKAKEDSIAKLVADAPDPFVTADLSFYDLRGHVKEVVDEHGMKHKYSESGKLKGETDDADPYHYYRDKNGLIEGSNNGHAMYTYDSEKRLKGWLWAHMGEAAEVEYIYDEKGLRIGETEWECKESRSGFKRIQSSEKRTMYADIVYDSHKNWTSRSVNGNKQKRTIKYY